MGLGLGIKISRDKDKVKIMIGVRAGKLRVEGIQGLRREDYIGPHDGEK